MTKFIMAMIAAPLLLTASLLASPAHATSCGDMDPALPAAVQEVLTGAKDARIARFAGYLNDGFYADFSCRLSPGMDASDVLRLRDAPDVLLDLAMGGVMNRNQSDALMLMLSAMKQGAGDQG